MATPETGHPHRWGILVVLISSLLMMVMDNTILTVALRTIADPVIGLGASQSELEWIVNAYTIVFAGLLFTSGVIADRHGRRLVLMTGLAVFGLSSFAAGFVNSSTELVVMRAVMAVGGALVMPATLAIISTVFSAEERGKAIGVWSGAVGMGIGAGPLLGGFLLEHFHWSSIFFVNVPVAAVALVAVALVVPESRNPRPGRHDPVGVILSIIGLAGLCFGLIRAGEAGLGDRGAMAAIAGSLILIAIFVVYESRIENPALDVRLFRKAQFSAAIGVIGTVFFILMGLSFFTAFYVQSVLGFGPFAAGAALIPMAVAQMIASPASAALVKRYGAKTVMAGSAIVLSLAMAVVATYQVDTSIVVPAANAALFGLAIGLIMPPATNAIVGAVPREKVGVGSAVSGTMRQVGGALGVAIIGSAMALVYRHGLGPSLGAVDGALRDRVASSVQATLSYADRVADPVLAAAAKAAYVNAMHIGGIVCAAIGLFAALVVLKWIPGRLAAIGPAPVKGSA